MTFFFQYWTSLISHNNHNSELQEFLMSREAAFFFLLLEAVGRRIASVSEVPSLEERERSYMEGIMRRVCISLSPFSFSPSPFFLALFFSILLCLSVCLFPTLYLSVGFSLLLSLVCLSFDLSVCLSVSLLLSLSLSLSLFLCVCVRIYEIMCPCL